MRLSEKTLELNFCAQFAAACGVPVLWYGLTQMEEAALGFDVATRLGGTSLLFQVKASRHTIRAGSARRFRLPHEQLVALRALVHPGRQRRVFYAFPMVGTTVELAQIGGDVFGHTWLLDVGLLSATASPTRRDGAPRRSHLHYADVGPPSVVVHSRPETYPIIPAPQLLREVEGELRGSPLVSPEAAHSELSIVARRLSQRRRAPWGRLVAAVLLPLGS